MNAGKQPRLEKLGSTGQYVAALHQSAVLEAAVPQLDMPSGSSGPNNSATGANVPLPLDLFASGSPAFGQHCRGPHLLL